MRRLVSLLLLMALTVTASGCVVGCRPGRIGPYGGIRPGGCVVY